MEKRASPCTHVCDACPRKDMCQAIFIQREILKDESRYLQDEFLRARIDETLEMLAGCRYDFPYAAAACCLHGDSGAAGRILTAMQELIAAVRLALREPSAPVHRRMKENS